MLEEKNPETRKPQTNMLNEYADIWPNKKNFSKKSPLGLVLKNVRQTEKQLFCKKRPLFSIFDTNTVIQVSSQQSRGKGIKGFFCITEVVGFVCFFCLPPFFLVTDIYLF